MSPFQTDTAAASTITDHAFVPRGAWYTVCGHLYWELRATHSAAAAPCGLAEAAHATTTVRPEERRTSGSGY